MSRVYIDLYVLLFGVLRVWISLYAQVAQHRADGTAAGWSHMQKWVGVAGLRCNAGIFLSVVKDWQF